MKKGFTLLELLIAAAISSIVALGVFSIFSSIANMRDSSITQSRNIILQESLTRLINRDARMMIGNSISLDKSGQVYRLKFSTQNSMRFNKALPVDVTYYIDDENYLIRKEENNDTAFSMEMRIIPNVTEFSASFYDGTEYKEDAVANAKMMNITLKINEQQIVIPVARTMDNT